MTRFSFSILCAAALLSASACAQEAQDAQPESPEAGAATESATARLITNDRSVIGSASFRQGPHGVLIRIEANGLPAGWHGAHLHMLGDCSSDDFTSSGGHINPDGGNHGLLNSGGPDNADLPNLFVAADGTLMAEVYTSRVSLTGGDGVPALLDADGSALIIHVGEDDHMSQPIGGAGARIGCGVIEAN